MRLAIRGGCGDSSYRSGNNTGFERVVGEVVVCLPGFVEDHVWHTGMFEVC